MLFFKKKFAYRFSKIQCKNRKIPLCLFCIVFMLFCITNQAFAKEFTEYGQWSFALLVGGESPDLKALDNVVFNQAVTGSGTIKQSQSQNSNVTVPFSFNTPMAVKNYGDKAGLELQWHANPTNSLIFGIGSWSKSGASDQNGTIPTQGVYNDVTFKRRAIISYAEYNLGWRYTFFRKSKLILYARTTIHEAFDVDYREDFIISYYRGIASQTSSSNTSGTGSNTANTATQAFNRARIVQAKTASMFMGEFALGGEWFFLKWLAVGVEAGYMRAEKSIQFQNAKLQTDYQSTDNISFDGGGSMAFYVNNGSNQLFAARKLNINFSGWQVMFHVNIYY